MQYLPHSGLENGTPKVAHPEKGSPLLLPPSPDFHSAKMLPLGVHTCFLGLVSPMEASESKRALLVVAPSLDWEKEAITKSACALFMCRRRAPVSVQRGS